jgi:hypothetical protein
MAGILSQRLDRLATGLGRGLIAGAAGTAAITLSATIEMKLRGRDASTVPQEVAAKVLGLEPESERAAKALGTAAHIASGLALGPVLPALDAAGVKEPAASATLFAVAWMPELVLVPVAGASEPPWKWGARELAISAVHHAAYTAAASAAWAALRAADS